MRYLLALAVLAIPLPAHGQQWGQTWGYRHRPYVQTPVRPYQGYSAQTVYLPNATFYQDSYGNSGMSVWSGNARFDTFNQVRPVPVNPWWRW